MKAIELSIKGVKCDNPSCDYRDDTAEYKDYEKFLNKPCPKCGSNLLTEKDLTAIKELIEITDVFNQLLSPFVKNNEIKERIAVIAEMDGTGKIEFKPKLNISKEEGREK